MNYYITLQSGKEDSWDWKDLRVGAVAMSSDKVFQLIMVLGK